MHRKLCVSTSCFTTTHSPVLSYIAVNDLTAELVGSSYRIAVDDLEDFLWIRTMGIVAYRDMSYSNL